MANITINEISQNYTYNIGASSYATVALPIMASWGPGFQYDESANLNLDSEVLENSVWDRFPATQAGLESFVSTYRGPANQYLKRKDFSYQMAMTLLTAGYDLLVCRVAGGLKSEGKFLLQDLDATNSYELPIKAKYSGTFGNSLRVALRKVQSGNYTYWNCITYIVDNYGARTAAENLNFVFNIEKATDTILHISEIESNFIEFVYTQAPVHDNVEFVEEGLPEGITFDTATHTMLSTMLGGTDHPSLGAGETERDAWNAALDVQATKKILADSAKAAVNAKLAEIEDTQAIIDAQQAIIDDEAPTQEQKDAAQAAKAEAEAAKAVLEADLGSEDDTYDPDNPPAVITLYAAFNVANSELEAATADANAAKQAYDNVADYLTVARNLAENRYKTALNLDDTSGVSYIQAYNKLLENDGSSENSSKLDTNTKINLCRREWTFNAAYSILGALDDKLAYNPNRIIVPGWDDQDISFLFDGDVPAGYPVNRISPLHQKLIDVAYYSRCATAYLDIPRSIAKADVYNDSISTPGYAQKLARIQETLYPSLSVNGSFYASHSALFAPWGKYIYVGTGKQQIASPSFLALMIDRAMIKNQVSQYEWELPTTRRHNLRIGKMDYSISKKYLDMWQSLEGVGVNCITRIPDLGVTLWGNSTLYEVPPATYQALANLSTRKLVNAVEDLAYRCGIAITFQYNNDQAYNAFYAGMTPLLDTMRNVGAIEDYYLRMAEDVNGLDQVNANSVVGKIYLVIDGVINDISIDLIALPPQTSLDDFRA